MTALTTMFNHLLGWFIACFSLLFGVSVDCIDTRYIGSEILEVAEKFYEDFFVLYPDFEPLSPIVLLPVGILVVGAIIGLARRLIRG